jgi:hypothetical protein
MAKFLIQPHVRLQEWVAEEHGYFSAEGLDYAFEEQGLAGGTRTRGGGHAPPRGRGRHAPRRVRGHGAGPRV